MLGAPRPPSRPLDRKRKETERLCHVLHTHRKELDTWATLYRQRSHRSEDYNASEWRCAAARLSAALLRQYLRGEDETATPAGPAVCSYRD